MGDNFPQDEDAQDWYGRLDEADIRASQQEGEPSASWLPTDPLASILDAQRWEKGSTEQRAAMIMDFVMFSEKNIIPRKMMPLMINKFLIQHPDWMPLLRSNKPPRRELEKEETRADLRVAVFEAFWGHPQAPPKFGTRVNIRLARNLNMVMELDKNNKKRGTNILLHTINGERGATNQRWILQADGHVALASDPQLAMDAWGAYGTPGERAPGDHAHIKLAFKEGGQPKNEKFVYRDGRLRWAHDERLCVDVTECRVQDGTPLQLSMEIPNHDERRQSQLWVLTPVEVELRPHWLGA